MISRAVAGVSSAGERQQVYERARIALVRQLRTTASHLNAEEVRFKRDLEHAIAKAESEATSQYRNRAVPPLRKDAQEIALSAIQDALNISDATKARKGQQPNQRRPNVPPIEVIPNQDFEMAIGFSQNRRGPLDLVLDPPKDPFDPEQVQLYQRIRAQLRQLQQDIPSQERAQIDSAINDFLAQPEDWGVVEFKKILWLAGNSVRAILAQHDSVKDNPEPHYSKLPPSVAEALRRPVQGWNIFVQGDHDLARLDAQRLGPQEQADMVRHLQAADRLIDLATSNREISTERAAKAISATMEAAGRQNGTINDRLALNLADKTSRNFFGQVLRRAYLLWEGLADPESQAAKQLALDLTKGAASAVGGVAAIYAGSHALAFLEFVATHPALVKEYILVVFQNSQMTEIVDAIEFEYRRLKKLANP